MENTTIKHTFLLHAHHLKFLRIFIYYSRSLIYDWCISVRTMFCMILFPFTILIIKQIIRQPRCGCSLKLACYSRKKNEKFDRPNCGEPKRKQTNVKKNICLILSIKFIILPPLTHTIWFCLGKMELWIYICLSKAYRQMLNIIMVTEAWNFSHIQLREQNKKNQKIIVFSMTFQFSEKTRLIWFE